MSYQANPYVFWVTETMTPNEILDKSVNTRRAVNSVVRDVDPFKDIFRSHRGGGDPFHLFFHNEDDPLSVNTLEALCEQYARNRMLYVVSKWHAPASFSNFKRFFSVDFEGERTRLVYNPAGGSHKSVSDQMSAARAAGLVIESELEVTSCPTLVTPKSNYFEFDSRVSTILRKLGVNPKSQETR